MKIGYSLINSNNVEVSFWGDTEGMDRSKPDPLKLPNDVVVHNPQINHDYSGYKLVERHLLDEPPSVWHAKIGREIRYDKTNKHTVVVCIYPDEPNIVPSTITPIQARKVLRALNIKDQVDALVATMDEDSKDAWEYATEIHRNNEVLASAAKILGTDVDKEIDKMFRLAVTL